MTLRTVTLRTARSLSRDVRELTFEPDGPMPFVPGQWVSLKLPQPDHDESLSRSYSIASPPRADGSFDIAVTRVEGGPGSTYLHAMNVGETLPVSVPAGFFTLPETPLLPVLFVGTGTGIAPLRAMLLDALARDVMQSFAVLQGARTEDDLIYAAEFDDLAGRFQRFEFVPTLSRPHDGWTGRSGYVQAHVPSLVTALGGECDVYVCGLRAMIHEVRRVLKEDLGFTRHHIHTERYD